ncbi:MAG: hypothetical protein NT154_47815, partial [Verrucomicrobia bacterium]|nr:hypothetical protein [Verrucomicrobiota bacterium]
MNSQPSTLNPMPRQNEVAAGQPSLALIGAGYWGKNLARNFNALGALHTLCDASQTTLSSYGDD